MNKLSLASLVISSFGVGFQVFILNPWHKKISLQINNLQKKMETRA